MFVYNIRWMGCGLEGSSVGGRVLEKKMFVSENIWVRYATAHAYR